MYNYYWVQSSEWIAIWTIYCGFEIDQAELPLRLNETEHDWDHLIIFNHNPATHKYKIILL